MTNKICPTWWARIYMSGCILEAKRVLRKECLREGLCVTIDPTNFIYSGGEEAGFVVQLIDYPRFPSNPARINERARSIMGELLEAGGQHSALLMTPAETEWISKRGQS